MNPLDLSAATVRLQPFPCFLVAQVLSEDSEQALLKWFESQAPWQLAVMDFYEQYGFDFKDVSIPESMNPLIPESTLNHGRDEVDKLRGAHLKPHIDINAHKLNQPMKISSQNDA